MAVWSWQKRTFRWTLSIVTESLARAYFVTSSKELAKNSSVCKFTVTAWHLHTLRSFSTAKKMVNRCVAANCSNKSSLSLGISLHTIPFFNDDRPEAKRRRKIWVDFVKAKRCLWTFEGFDAMFSALFTRRLRAKVFNFTWTNET